MTNHPNRAKPRWPSDTEKFEGVIRDAINAVPDDASIHATARTAAAVILAKYRVPRWAQQQAISEWLESIVYERLGYVSELVPVAKDEDEEAA